MADSKNQPLAGHLGIQCGNLIERSGQSLVRCGYTWGAVMCPMCQRRNSHRVDFCVACEEPLSRRAKRLTLATSRDENYAERLVRVVGKPKPWMVAGKSAKSGAPNLRVSLTVQELPYLAPDNRRKRKRDEDVNEAPREPWLPPGYVFLNADYSAFCYLIHNKARSYGMQPIQHLEQWLRNSQSSGHGHLYTAASFRSLFPGLNPGAYRALIHRAERRGLLERVCQGVYQYSGSPGQTSLILFHAAALLRARNFNYISLETALSDAGLISQVPMAWITIVSTGRSAQIDCGRFGRIEFLHTKRSMSGIVGELTYDSDCHLFRASPKLALEDMRRFKRPTTDLLQDASDDSF